jgi:flagellar L-ring protein FlgH
MSTNLPKTALLLSTACLLAGLAGCGNYEQIAEAAKGGPELSPIARPGEKKPVDLLMPQPSGEMHSVNSLWQPGAKSFFRDPRASRVGDIITVAISIADAAKISNSTTRTRTNTEDAGMTNMFGLENLLPSTMTTGSLYNTNSDTSNAGTGTINRSETISLTLAALVTQVLPNSNLVIGGHQQVKVNGEMRDLTISGIVRTEDITSSNTVNLTQIAEARIAYGGKGAVSDVQQPRWGSRIIDALLPW